MSSAQAAAPAESTALSSKCLSHPNQDTDIDYQDVLLAVPL